MASYYPLIGSWYRDHEKDQRFEVVAIDEHQKTIEVQHYDGDIGEYDIEAWGRLQLVEIDAPAEAYRQMDGGSVFGEDSDHAYIYGQANPLESIEPDSFNGFDDLF